MRIGVVGGAATATVPRPAFASAVVLLVVDVDTS
jgi:hypothetical protein